MMSETQLLELINKTYTSLKEPQYHSISKAYKKNIYKDTIEKLMKVVSLNETTDLNDDVAYVFDLKMNGFQGQLSLSLISKIALLTGGFSNDVKFIEPSDMYSDPVLSDLKRILEKDGFVFLPSKLLEKKISINLQNCEPEDTRIYQALFGDYYELPWSISQHND